MLFPGLPNLLKKWQVLFLLRQGHTFASLTFVNWHVIRNDSNAVASSGGLWKEHGMWVHFRWSSHCRLFMHILLNFSLSLSSSVLQCWSAPLTYNRRLSGTSQVMWELCVHLLCSFTEASFTMHSLFPVSTQPQSIPCLGPSLLCWPTFPLTCLCRLLSTPIKSDQDGDVLLLLSSSLGNVTLSLLHRHCVMARIHDTIDTVPENKEATLCFCVFLFCRRKDTEIST